MHLSLRKVEALMEPPSSPCWGREGYTQVFCAIETLFRGYVGICMLTVTIDMHFLPTTFTSNYSVVWRLNLCLSNQLKLSSKNMVIVAM